MEISTKALCIKATDIKENDKLLTLVSGDLGRITAMAKAVKTPKSKLKHAASPLFFGEYFLKKHSGIYIVAGAVAEEGFYNCWGNLERYTASQLILELLDKSTMEGGECADELLLTLKALNAVNYMSANPYIAALWFMTSLAPLIGVDIETFDIPEKTLSVLNGVHNAEISDIDSMNITQAELYDAIKYMNLALRNALGGKINSAEFLI